MAYWVSVPRTSFPQFLLWCLLPFSFQARWGLVGTRGHLEDLAWLVASPRLRSGHPKRGPIWTTSGFAGCP